MTGQILGAHPNAVLLDEDHGLYGWFDKFAQGDVGEEIAFSRMLEKALSTYTAASDRIRSCGDGRFALAPHVSHLILKAPNLTHRYDELVRHSPLLKVVFLVRDPKAVVSSMAGLDHIPMVENQHRFLGSVPSLAERFKTELAQIGDPALAIHKRRAMVWRLKTGLFEAFIRSRLPTFVMKYEDLVLDEEAKVRQLAEHVDLPFHRSLLSHQEVLQGIGPGGTNRRNAIGNASLEKWRSDLDDVKAAEIMEIAGSLAVRFGYR